MLFVCLFVADDALLIGRDERIASVSNPFASENGNENQSSTSTIAAIVTSVGGPTAAVGIVRLSGPLAVQIAATLFRPLGRNRKKKKLKQCKFTWEPTSHVVEYGLVYDHLGNIVDEVMLLCL